MQVPAQPNLHDCGVYLLHFADVFLHNPLAMTFRVWTTFTVSCSVVDHFLCQHEDPWPNRDAAWKGGLVQHMRKRLINSYKKVKEGEVKWEPLPSYGC